MTRGRIQDPKEAKTTVVSYKTTTRAAARIGRQLFKIVCFEESISGKLIVDTYATMGGKHDPNKQRRKMILVYKTSMHAKSQLNSAPCGPKADPRTKHTWLIRTLRHLDQYSPTIRPPSSFTEDIETEADLHDYTEHRKEQIAPTTQDQPTPPEVRGTQPQEVVPPAQTAYPIPTTDVRQTAPVTHLRFGTPKPPKVPYKTRSGPAAVHQGSTSVLHNRFAPPGSNRQCVGRNR